MELTIYWTAFAVDKLDNIYEYYKIQSGNTQVPQKLVNSIIVHVSGLEKHPHMGQKEELLFDRPQNFSYLVYKNYKIIYWINESKNRIDIVHVFDTRQTPSKIKQTV